MSFLSSCHSPLLTADLVPGKVGKACINSLFTSNVGTGYLPSRDNNSIFRKISINAVGGDGITSTPWASSPSLEQQFRQAQFNNYLFSRPTSSLESSVGGGGHSGNNGRGYGGFGGRGGGNNGWSHFSDDSQDYDWWFMQSAVAHTKTQKSLMWQVLCFLGMVQTINFMLFTNHTCEPLLWEDSEEEEEEEGVLDASDKNASTENTLAGPCCGPHTSHQLVYGLQLVPVHVSQC